MSVPGLFSGCVYVRQSDPVRFSGRCDRLAGVATPETGVAAVHEHFHVREVLGTGPDGFVACGGHIVHPPWPQDVGPESAALRVGEDSGLHRVLLVLARDARSAAAVAGCGSADLDLGGIQPQARTVRDAFPRSARSPHISPIARVSVE